MTINKRLIMDEAQQLFDFAVADGRAEELAAEIERLNATVAVLATRLELEDEPQRFLPTMWDVARG